MVHGESVNKIDWTIRAFYCPRKKLASNEVLFYFTDSHVIVGWRWTLMKIIKKSDKTEKLPEAISKKENVKDVILTEATNLFYEFGYPKTSIRDITKKIKI